MGLFAALGGMAEAVAVVALGVPVGVDGFLDLEPLGEEEKDGRSFCTSSGLTETTTEVACMEILVARSLLRYLAALISTAFALRIDVLRKENSWSSSSGRTSMGTECIASYIAVGARENGSQGEDPVGCDWWRCRVMASK